MYFWTLIQWLAGMLHLQEKQPEDEADHSPLPIAEVLNMLKCLQVARKP
jgi:hypothetical protein